jgi:hypothetical protein
VAAAAAVVPAYLRKLFLEKDDPIEAFITSLGDCSLFDSLIIKLLNFN